MNILIVMMYLLGAYGIFMAVTYVLAKFLFPKVEEDRNAVSTSLRMGKLKQLPKASSKMKQLKKGKEETLAF